MAQALVNEYECEETCLNNGKHLKQIEQLDAELLDHFADRAMLDKSLTRQVVSFQANKKRPSYRWYKYKEAFSAYLVESLLERFDINQGKILDPFAGTGTTLFAATELGFDADGIELLPIGQEIINARIICQKGLSKKELSRLEAWQSEHPWTKIKSQEPLNTLRITAGAYPNETEEQIKNFLLAIKAENPRIRALLKFALLCTLESISYTRKDGQYLRWDYRSGRRKGKSTFDKGKILTFDDAIRSKLSEILGDLKNEKVQTEVFDNSPKERLGRVNLIGGSCLTEMPKLKSDQYSAIITSPPYCNRYDYTRTYALEHALLGIGESELIDLRQQMLSCTVENREKELMSSHKEWEKTLEDCERNVLLQSVIAYLFAKKEKKELNNSGIPRMVKGYFYEMACVIQECHRVIKTGGRLFMVNDNVRYAGASISVDLILSRIAEEVGFYIENILVLPQKKGNSSQQMGVHGRDALRKSVYVWKK